MIWYVMTWYDMIWYNMIWYDIKWYDMEWYNMIWYDMIWYDKIWKYYDDMILCYVILYPITLHNWLLIYNLPMTKCKEFRVFFFKIWYYISEQAFFYNCKMI